MSEKRRNNRKCILLNGENPCKEKSFFKYFDIDGKSRFIFS